MRNEIIANTDNIKSDVNEYVNFSNFIKSKTFAIIDSL